MKLNEDFVPSTIDEAINYLFENLSEEDKDFIKCNPNEGCHFTVGMNLRNNWSLWEENTPIKNDFKKRFNLFGHGDDMSGIILKGLFNKVKGFPLNLEEEAEKYRQHWLKFGLDPETGKPWILEK